MTKHTLSILGGTGKEGPGLAMRWAHVGYKVIIGSRQAEKAQATATELNEKLMMESLCHFESSMLRYLSNTTLSEQETI